MASLSQELGNITLKLFKELDVKIDFSNTENCHWLPGKGPKRVAIKFSTREDTNSIRMVKKNLKGMDLSSIGTILQGM